MYSPPLFCKGLAQSQTVTLEVQAALVLLQNWLNMRKVFTTIYSNRKQINIEFGIDYAG